jgi:HEAT repeat protein
VHRLLRDHFALRELRPNLHHEEFGRRIDAIRGLGFQGDAAVETLADLLANDPNPVIRAEAVLSLGRIASPEVIPHLQRGCRDNDPRVRRATVLSVSKRSMDEAREFILAGIGDRDQEVRDAAIEVTFAGPFFYHYLGPQFVSDHFQQEDLLSLARLVERKPDQIVVQSAAAAFASIRTNGAVDVLSNLLQHRNPRLRAMAAGALRVQRNARAIPGLAKALTDTEKSVRTNAARALTAIGTEEALEVLVDSRHRSPFLGSWRRSR